MGKTIIYFTIYVMSMNVIAFFIYGLDKWRAKRHVWRISEKFLLTISFFGGVIGALIAMHLFHHKTRKWYFWFTHVMAIVFLCTIYGCLLYF